MEDNQTHAYTPPTTATHDSLTSPVVRDAPSQVQENTQGTQSLLIEMRALRQDFETKVKYDESKERLIESLHRELQVYREGLHFRVLRPVFNDLITLHDDIGKLIAAQTTGAEGPIAATRDLAFFQETIEDILQRYGVETFMLSDEVFQSQKQKSSKVVATADQTLDKHVARRVRKGFLYEEKVLRPEIVEIFKYTPTTAEQ